MTDLLELTGWTNAEEVRITFGTHGWDYVGDVAIRGMIADKRQEEAAKQRKHDLQRSVYDTQSATYNNQGSFRKLFSNPPTYPQPIFLYDFDYGRADAWEAELEEIIALRNNPIKTKT